MNRILENSIFGDKRYALLLEDLDRTKEDLDSAYMKLSNVIEPDLIDCYIYEVQSVQMRYKFLLSRVKQIEDSYAKNPLEVSGS
ncbi:MAG: YaaL family protein [Lachnospiraceae bacterium]|nr:YaaL family protein [Lachnospiraceae bacterium]